jgi:hypothetical protein
MAFRFDGHRTFPHHTTCLLNPQQHPVRYSPVTIPTPGRLHPQHIYKYQATMKYTATLLASMAAIASAERNLATLAEKWNLTEPTFTYDANTFSLVFNVTDYIVNGQANYSLWTAPDCQSDNGIALQNSPIFESHSSTPNTALVNGARDENAASSGRATQIDITFDPEEISSQDAVTQGIYSQEVVDNQQIATVKFCVRFGLWTTTAMGVKTPVEVNFLETLLTLFVDLTDGFQIGAIEVAPKDRLVRTANQAYEVSGYECSAASTDRVDSTAPRNQGEIVYVCVTPEDEAQTDGIFMRSIDDFAWTRGATIRQVAIENNRPSANLLTSYDYVACEGSLVCKFSTILFAQFYATPGQVDGEGVASMQFGSATGTGTTRRQLRSGDRDLQADEGAGAAEFELNFQVNEAAARTQSGAGSLSIGVGAIAAVVAAML